MSHKTSSFDVLGESHIPSDLLTPTLGSNYGLDGFEDMAYGMGVLEGVLDPDMMPAPALPTGLSRGAAEELDLSSMLDEGEAPDLSWLGSEHFDPSEELPALPEAEEELEVALGEDDGVTFWEQDLDQVRYARSLEEGPKKVRASAGQLTKVATHAMRRSVKGHDIQTVVKEAMESMGEAMGSLAPLMKRVKAEHGLHGRVYVRASAYPNWGTGKWAPEVKKFASRARYLLVSTEDLENSTWIKEGRCQYTSKIAVTEIPWGDAWAYYAPRLRSAGVEVQETGNPERDLRTAFLAAPKEARPDTENRPVLVTPDQRVSHQEARRAFDAYTPTRKVYDPTEARQKALRARVAGKLAQMVTGGILPNSEAQALLKSGASNEDVLKAAARIATRVKTGAYRGQAGTLEALNHIRSLEASRRAADSNAAAERVAKIDPHAKAREARVEKAEGYIRGLIGRGLLTEKVASEILRSSYDLQDKVRAAASLSFKTAARSYRGDYTTLVGAQALRDAESARRMKEAQESEGRVREHDEALSAKALQNWVATKKVTAARVAELTRQLGDPRKVAHVLVPEVAQLQLDPKKYAGSGVNREKPPTFQEAKAQIEASLKKAQSAQASLDSLAAKKSYATTYDAKVQGRVASLVQRVGQEIDRGVSGTTLRNFIARTVPKDLAPSVLKELAPVFQKTSALEDRKKEPRAYDKTPFTRAASEAKGRSVLAGQIRTATQWLRRSMSEGWAGTELDSLLGQRFSEAVLKEGSSQIQEARKAHEGLAGFLYVDAEAYASPSGSTGCEKFASKHRANQIPYVREMERCASCSLVRVLEDGSRKCGVFNKVLAPMDIYLTEGADTLREKNIAAAGMTDAEATSSLFAPTYQDEFGLSNSNLEGFEVDNLPENDKISILFGGWDL